MAAETKEQGQPQTAKLREVQREVQQLQERVEQLAQTAAPEPPAPPAPPTVLSDPDVRARPPAPPHPLQDVLPQIKDLAQRVGGMKELAQIVTTLAQTKE